MNQSVWVQNRPGIIFQVTDQLVEDFIQTREAATLGQEGFGEFTLVQGSKIQLNQLWYRLRVPGSQRHIHTQKFLKYPPRTETYLLESFSMPFEFGRTSEDLLTAEVSKRFLQIISGQLNCYLFVLVVHLKDIKNFLTLSMKSSFPLSMSLYIISNSLFTAHRRNSNAFLQTQHGNIIS